MTSLDHVVCVTPERGLGWAPVTLMAELAAKVFGARLTFIHPTTDYSLLQRSVSLLGRRRGGAGVLAIVAHPGDLLALARLRLWRHGADPLAAWIIDSFWSERLPRFARVRGAFDYLFVTDPELVGEYASATCATTHWLPWGTDTLAVPDFAALRPVDVARVGRQPESWARDEVNAATFERAGLAYTGRPPFGRHAWESQDNVRRAMGRSKTVMAWGNSHSPASYTHPTREYISARWTDAVASGAQILGIPPRTAATGILGNESLVVPEGTTGAAVLAAATAAKETWTQGRSLRLGLHAVEHLDWRHRFTRIAEVLDVRRDGLDAEMSQLAVRSRLLKEVLLAQD